MTPINFSVKNGITHFHYKYSDLKYFVSRGNSHGDAGPVLVKREGTLLTYKSYGTIEHPSTHRHTISMKHHPVIDGELPSDQEICSPPKTRPFGSHSFMMIDLSK